MIVIVGIRVVVVMMGDGCCVGCKGGCKVCYDDGCSDGDSVDGNGIWFMVLVFAVVMVRLLVMKNNGASGRTGDSDDYSNNCIKKIMLYP